MNPLDLKSFVLPRHAQHVVLVHFPIGLFLTGVACDFVSQWRKKEALRMVADFNLRAAAISVVPVVLTGILAWQWQLAGQRLKGPLLFHLLLGCCSAALICWVTWLGSRWRLHPSRGFRGAYNLLALLAVTVIALTAHLGGFLTGVNGR